MEFGHGYKDCIVGFSLYRMAMCIKIILDFVFIRFC